MLTAKPGEHAARDAARVLNGIATMEQLAALHGATPDAAVAWFDDPEFLRNAERFAAQAEQSGDVIRDRARAALNVVVERLRAVVDDPETAASMVLRVGDLMTKLAGLARPETSDEARGAGFQFNIIFRGGETLSLGGTRVAPATPPADTINVQAREVGHDR